MQDLSRVAADRRAPTSMSVRRLVNAARDRRRPAWPGLSDEKSLGSLNRGIMGRRSPRHDPSRGWSAGAAHGATPPYLMLRRTSQRLRFSMINDLRHQGDIPPITSGPSERTHWRRRDWTRGANVCWGILVSAGDGSREKRGPRCGRRWHLTAAPLPLGGMTSGREGGRIGGPYKGANLACRSRRCAPGALTNNSCLSGTLLPP
jgi:hypothetical protein